MRQMLIQIVPGLPPAINGVGDYALSLACAMRRDFRLDTLFVVGNDGWQGPEAIEGFRVRKLAARSAKSLGAELDAAPAITGASSVLLQMSGYGYSKRGCPIWLLQGLKRWRRKQPGSRLVTMFHEMYAFGPPWRSAFWLNPVQRMLVTGIARLSDSAATNIEPHRKHLEYLDPSKRNKIRALPIPSGVGEPLEPGDLLSRPRSMVVFGQPQLRKLTYQTQMAALQRACQQLGITEVCDAGKFFDGIPDSVGDVPVRRFGLMDATEVSSLLSRSTAGFVTYQHAFLAKSSVFGAYCAHRIIPVVPWMPGRSQREADGIQCGVQYHGVSGKQEAELQLTQKQSIADAAWEWYKSHSLRCHARAFADTLLSGLSR
jgi:hypothetical protein